MAETSTRAWTRWQDWAEVVFGVVALLSPLWVTHSTGALVSLLVLGVLITIDGVVSLAVPGLVASEGVQVVLGVLLFIAPWVIGYTAFTAASWWSWVLGALTVIAGGVALPAANTVHGALHGARLTGQH